MSHEQTQRELDRIMMETGIMEKGKKEFSLKWVERVVLGILTVFGLAVAAALVKSIGL